MRINILSKPKSKFKHVKLDSNVTRKEIPFQGLQKLKLSNDFNAVIEFSETEEEIIVEANENLHQYIHCKYEDEVLKLNKEFNIMFKGKQILNVYIKCKPFFLFRASDDVTINVKSLITADDLHIKIDDDSIFNGKVAIKNANIIAKDDSIVNIEGNIDDLNLRLSGDSVMKNYKLSIDRIEARLSGDSIAELTVNESVKCKTTGDSSFRYKGNAILVRQD
mgnify:CR=1 FL=1